MCSPSDKPDKISILMPVYNAGRFLQECLDSILRQSDNNWELLAVDDFSTDDSHDILCRYSTADSRMKVLSNEQKGIIPALRLAYAQAKGSYVTRMDADDIMKPVKLHRLRAALEGGPGEVAVGKVEYFSTGKDLADGYLKYAAWLNALIDNDNHYEQIYKECVIPSPCWMMSRTTLDRIGAFDGSLYPEDYDLVLRMYQHKLQIEGVHEVLHLWRDHDSRASRCDDHYADQAFLPLKLSYFLKIDRDYSVPLVLWGAGRSGKEVAKHLLQHEVEFTWITDNANKIGHDIYGIKLKSDRQLVSITNCQVLVAIKATDFSIDHTDLDVGRAIFRLF